MERWVGKIAVVTGASAGIGAATVQALAGKGLIVVALARRQDKLQEVADSSKGTVHIRQCDLSKEEDIVKTFEWIEASLGGVDILINNAGVIKPASLASGTTADWMAILNTNVVALSICTREALKTMRRRGDCGHIIHVNSVAGHHVPQFLEVPIGMYSASKFAVTSLTEALRIELQALNSNVKITSVSPGAVYTDMIRNLKAESTGTLPEPVGPVPPIHLMAEDVTDAIVYCLSTRPLVQVHELIIQPIGQRISGQNLS